MVSLLRAGLWEYGAGQGSHCSHIAPRPVGRQEVRPCDRAPSLTGGLAPELMPQV